MMLFALAFCESFAQKETIKTVKIGNQVWMAKNLDVARFRNGDPIPEAKNYQEWQQMHLNKQPATCYYNFDPLNGKKHGRLYNGYAVKDPRGLAPKGFHVPSDMEWTILENFLGGNIEANNKLKSKTGWISNCRVRGKIQKYNSGGTNSSGFNALPGGHVFYGRFSDLGIYGDWWSSTLVYDHTAWSRRLSTCHNDFDRRQMGTEVGLSVRCIKDDNSGSNIDINKDIIKNNNSESSISPQDEVIIGKQTWMSKNLDIDKFRNGDPIFQAKNKMEWSKANSKRKPAWCYYNYQERNGKKYGKLYNWYAVNDSRGIAPTGYHVPSDEEWTILVNFLGGESVAGEKIKNKTSFDINGKNTNSSQFNGLPGGCCETEGGFEEMGTSGYFWSSSDKDGVNAWQRCLELDKAKLNRFVSSQDYGFSVRCLKD
jgi:uncharacterized protein (TIGR02145 family)